MIPDNYEVWAQHDAGQQTWEKNRPVCDCCGEHIQDDCYINIDFLGKKLCMSCIEELKVRID